MTGHYRATPSQGRPVVRFDWYLEWPSAFTLMVSPPILSFRGVPTGGDEDSLMSTHNLVG